MVATTTLIPAPQGSTIALFTPTGDLFGRVTPREGSAVLVVDHEAMTCESVAHALRVAERLAEHEMRALGLVR